MSSKSKISPITKIFFIFSLSILVLWVIPNVISYYKNQNIYTQKVEELNRLDKRDRQIDAKPFHLELFKLDAKKYFSRVDIVSAPQEEYNVTISFPVESLSKFYDFFKNISLNYRVSVDNNIIYEKSDKSIKVNFMVKPY